LLFGKAGIAPAFCFDEIAAAHCCHALANQQQTVDGVHTRLEIRSRSSYVPSLPIGVRSRFPAKRALLVRG
jgi:hypothetical protein